MMQYTVHWYWFILKLLEAEMADVLTRTLAHCVGEVKIIWLTSPSALSPSPLLHTSVLIIIVHKPILHLSNHIHYMNLCSGCHFDWESVCTCADYAHDICHMILNLIGSTSSSVFLWWYPCLFHREYWPGFLSFRLNSRWMYKVIYLFCFNYVIFVHPFWRIAYSNWVPNNVTVHLLKIFLAI
jgi:hypothetical protein